MRHRTLFKTTYLISILWSLLSMWINGSVSAAAVMINAVVSGPMLLLLFTILAWQGPSKEVKEQSE